MSKRIIDKAIETQKDIEFYYTKYSGKRTKRRVSSINYCNEYGEYGYHKDHISGYCHLRKEKRTFRISRMSKIRLYSSVTSSEPKEGCYIASLVFGDYNHPKVIILRDFRDTRLSNYFLGKAFISIYYIISPKLVKILEGHNKINNTIRRILDKFIRLIEKSAH